MKVQDPPCLSLVDMLDGHLFPDSRLCPVGESTASSKTVTCKTAVSALDLPTASEIPHRVVDWPYARDACPA